MRGYTLVNNMRGTARVTVAVGVQVHVACTRPFSVVGIRGDEQIVLTPLRAHAFGLVGLYDLPDDVDTFEVDTSSDARWSYSYRPLVSGREHPDPTPVSLPIGVRPESQGDRIRALVRLEMQRQRELQGDFDVETFEESDDFNDDVDFDDRPTSYEDQGTGDLERETREPRKSRRRVDKGTVMDDDDPGDDNRVVVKPEENSGHGKRKGGSSEDASSAGRSERRSGEDSGGGSRSSGSEPTSGDA